MLKFIIFYLDFFRILVVFFTDTVHFRTSVLHLIFALVQSCLFFFFFFFFFVSLLSFGSASCCLQLALWDSLTWPCILFTYLQADKTFAYSHILESGIEWHYPKGNLHSAVRGSSHAGKLSLQCCPVIAVIGFLWPMLNLNLLVLQCGVVYLCGEFYNFRGFLFKFFFKSRFWSVESSNRQLLYGNMWVGNF